MACPLLEATHTVGQTNRETFILSLRIWTRTHRLDVAFFDCLGRTAHLLLDELEGG